MEFWFVRCNIRKYPCSTNACADDRKAVASLQREWRKISSAAKKEAGRPPKLARIGTTGSRFEIAA
jgi:hypothetical protein